VNRDRSAFFLFFSLSFTRLEVGDIITPRECAANFNRGRRVGTTYTRNAITLTTIISTTTVITIIVATICCCWCCCCSYAVAWVVVLKWFQNLLGTYAAEYVIIAGVRRRRWCARPPKITAALVVPARLLVRKSIGYPKKYWPTSTISVSIIIYFIILLKYYCCNTTPIAVWFFGVDRLISCTRSLVGGDECHCDFLAVSIPPPRRRTLGSPDRDDDVFDRIDS